MARETILQLMVFAFWIALFVYGVTRATTRGTKLIAPVAVIGIAGVMMYFGLDTAHAAMLMAISVAVAALGLLWTVYLARQLQ
jgi:hypothetical protein